MSLGLLSDRQRAPAECIVTVGGEEIDAFYPYLTEVLVQTSRSEAWVATLHFDSRRHDERGRWSVQDAGVLAPWSEIVIEAAFGSHVEEVMSGYIREVVASYPEEPGAAGVTVTCQDRSLALDRRHVRTVWGGEAPMEDETIIRTILSQHGLSLDRESRPGLDGLVVNQDSTDIRFLRRRADANGFELIFHGAEVYFGPMRVDGEPQATILVYAGPDTNCISLEIRADAHQPDRVDVDLAASTGTERIELKIKPDLALLGSEPADQAGGGLPDFAWRMSRQGAANEAELRARAQGRANELAMKILGEGELDGSLYGHVLKVGRPVRVDGAGDWLSGIYYVDQVDHRFTVDGYWQKFRLLRNAFGDDAAPPLGPLGGVL